MLFNKHSETKQRFGIRKLTIGACSVLLSTLFLTVNNGAKISTESLPFYLSINLYMYINIYLLFFILLYSAKNSFAKS